MAVVHEPLSQPAQVAEIVERACTLILAELQPERIMLFGSQARGDAQEGSDIDLLVVLRQTLSKEESRDYSRQLSGLGKYIDVKFAEYEKFVHEAAIIGTLYNAALTEGRVLYIDSLEVRMTAEDWFERAVRDIDDARALAQIRPDSENATWHALQAAEKAIKGLLISKAIRHERSHDLVELCAGLGPGHPLLAMREELEYLTKVGTGSRYPNQLDVAARDVGLCLTAADKVIAIVRSELDSSLIALRELLAGYRLPWWVCGGWAVDLQLGRVTREHKDIEIAIPRRDLPLLREYFGAAEWDVVGRDKAGMHGLRSLASDETPQPQEHELYVDLPGLGRLEVLLNEIDDTKWRYRREPQVSLPLAKLGGVSVDGIPYFAPEVVLLYKAKTPREPDEQDFAALLPTLTPKQRVWLADALMLTHPQRGWVARLRKGLGFFGEMTGAKCLQGLGCFALVALGLFGLLVLSGPCARPGPVYESKLKQGRIAVLTSEDAQHIQLLGLVQPAGDLRRFNVEDITVDGSGRATTSYGSLQVLHDWDVATYRKLAAANELAMSRQGGGESAWNEVDLPYEPGWQQLGQAGNLCVVVRLQGEYKVLPVWPED